ncbi:hypothetical protein Godav_001638, partial [Gossypium davidsonii]|nr:hypothetical protein [Gossypium davidsonii]MBA0668769.1 hypothetical protein [Gossypium klotzschianum]
STASESSLLDHLINIWEFIPGPVPRTCVYRSLPILDF